MRSSNSFCIFQSTQENINSFLISKNPFIGRFLNSNSLSKSVRTSEKNKNRVFRKSLPHFRNSIHLPKKKKNTITIKRNDIKKCVKLAFPVKIDNAIFDEYNVFLETIKTTEIDYNSLYEEVLLLSDMLQQQSDTLALKRVLTEYLRTVIRKNIHSEIFLCLFYWLWAEVNLDVKNIIEAEEAFNYCEYYSRKLDCYSVVLKTLLKKSEIALANYKGDYSFSLLKDALQISIVMGNLKYQSIVLFKISKIYYYKGNIFLASHYEELAQKGLPQYQKDAIRKQYLKDDELKKLENLIFRAGHIISRKKTKQEMEMNIYKNLHQKIEFTGINKVNQLIKNMFKEPQMIQQGLKIKRHSSHLKKISQIKLPLEKSENKKSITPGFKSTVHNYSQILRSHHSRTRMEQNFQKELSLKSWRHFVLQIISTIQHEVQNL